MNIKKIILSSLKYIALLLWVFIIFFPLITVFFGAFKTSSEFINTSGITPPENFFNFDNFKRAFINGKMLIGFINTFIILLFGVIGSVLVGSLVAFTINRFNFKFKKTIVAMYLLVSIVPLEVSQVATFKVINALGLYNTRFAAIVIYLGADVLMMFIYLQNLEKIPRDLDKAALLEGASYFGVYRNVVFPLLKPATATVCMIKTIAIYNDFYIPFLYMPSPKLKTLSTTLFNFIGIDMVEWHVICAAIIISMIPMIIFFIFLQKYIYKGLTAGGIK